MRSVVPVVFVLAALVPLCAQDAAQGGKPGAVQRTPIGPELVQQLARRATEAPLTVAHRGASSDHPENTLAAFWHAVELGAPVVEFDVYQSQDGVWVCLHDETLDRTTDAVERVGRRNVRVDAVPFATLQQLDAGKWFGERFVGERLPTLEQALRAIRPAVPMIERKGGDAGSLVAELQRLEVVDAVLVQSFDWDWLAAVHRLEPRLAIAALGDEPPTPERLAELERTGASIVHWNHRVLPVEVADELRATRLLCVYTVDPDFALLGAAALGCDLITTNRPARAEQLRAAGRLSRPASAQGR